MSRIKHIEFNLDFPNGFVADCCTDDSSATAYDIFEFLKLPWNTIYEEHVLCAKINYIGQLVDKVTHIFIEGEVVEINGNYYRLIEKDISDFKSKSIVVFKFTVMEEYNDDIYLRAFSNRICQLTQKQTYELLEMKGFKSGTPQFSDEAYKQMREFQRNCAIYRVEAYDEKSNDIKIYGFNFYELELARRTVEQYSVVDIYLFENVKAWSREDFLPKGTLEYYLKIYHGFLF